MDIEDTIILERDYWEYQATKLAELVGQHLGIDVGELNCPVENAIEALEAKRGNT